jgi:hypothetical protein
MAIRTSIQPRQIIRNVVMLLLCVGFGIWGWYDFAIKIPALETAVTEHAKLLAVTDSAERRKAEGGTLTAAEIEAYEMARAELAARFKERPEPPAAYDRAVQLWVYVVGCGILGTVWCIWALWSLSRKRYALEDDDSLVLPEGRYPVADLKGIDMSRWMEKSIAVVELPNGDKALLDDYKYKNVDRIVGAIAQRFHPDDWTDEAKPVRKSAESESASNGDARADSGR